MNIAIIDDIQEDCRILYDTVSSFYKTKDYPFNIDLFSNGESFIKKHHPGTFDLIFLDIYMNGMDGIETARKIRETDDSCSLIFVTCSDSFASSSYDVHAAYYLLKPLDQSKLHQVLDRISPVSSKKPAVLEVISGRTPVEIPVRNILYADTYRNALQIHTDAGTIRTYITVQKFEDLVSEYKSFLFCYRGCIVNMDRISRALEDGFLMDNGETVHIRKRGSSSIKKAYLQYLFSSEEHT